MHELEHPADRPLPLDDVMDTGPVSWVYHVPPHRVLEAVRDVMTVDFGLEIEDIPNDAKIVVGEIRSKARVGELGHGVGAKPYSLSYRVVVIDIPQYPNYSLVWIDAWYVVKGAGVRNVHNIFDLGSGGGWVPIPWKCQLLAEDMHKQVMEKLKLDPAEVIKFRQLTDDKEANRFIREHQVKK